MPTNILYFGLTLLATLYFPQLGASLFPPFLVYTFYRNPKMTALGWSVTAGLIPDLLSPHTPFGLYPFVNVLTTLFLYDKKQFFFIDNLSTLPLMTFFFTLLNTALLALFAQIPLSLSWIAGELILNSLIVSLVSFILYTIPQNFFGPKRRRGDEYFI